MWLLTRAFTPAQQAAGYSPHKTPGQGTMKHMVEVLAAYSHLAQAADLRLYTVAHQPCVRSRDRARNVRGAIATA